MYDYGPRAIIFSLIFPNLINFFYLFEFETCLSCSVIASIMLKFVHACVHQNIQVSNKEKQTNLWNVTVAFYNKTRCLTRIEIKFINM